MQDPNTLRSCFHADLEAESRRNAWGVQQRVIWILNHLDEYIERWLGFAAMHIRPEALVQSDMFTTLEIAIDALEQEFAKDAAASENGYLRNIRNNLEFLQKHGGKEYAIAIRTLAAELRSTSTPSV